VTTQTLCSHNTQRTPHHQYCAQLKTVRISQTLFSAAVRTPHHSAPPTCHLHALRARPQIQHVTRTSAQSRPRPPTHPRRRLRLSLLAPLSKQGVRQSPWPTAGAQTHTNTHRQAGAHHRGPQPMARTRTHASCPPTHPLTHVPTHPRTVRAPPTDTCAHVRFLIRVPTLSRLGYLLFMSWCSVV
jgi:hypothetical protein